MLRYDEEAIVVFIATSILDRQQSNHLAAMFPDQCLVLVQRGAVWINSAGLFFLGWRMFQDQYTARSDLTYPLPNSEGGVVGMVQGVAVPELYVQTCTMRGMGGWGLFRPVCLPA